jgi:DNA-binding Lrp family transcriptional regulator
LIETGVIKVLAVLNPEAVGFKANALIGIRVVPGKAETLRDPDELYDFISKHVHKIAGIVSTETYYVMRTQKFDYEWKLPEELPKG